MYNRVQMLWSSSLELNESTEWHSHEVFELVFCSSGSGLLMVEDKRIDLCQNRLVLVVPDTLHRFLFENDQSAHLKIVCITSQDQAIYLSPVQVAMLESLRSRGCAFSDGSSGIPMLRELTRVIPEGTVVGDRREVLTVWGIVSLLLASQADAYEEISLKSPRTRHGDRMEAVCVWLNEHLSEEMNLDEMASKFALSRSLLTRSFRQHTGTSIVEYVNARRLEKAAVLLTATADENILHAAIESGFSNLSHFHRRFKAAYGLTPAEFRRNFSN